MTRSNIPGTLALPLAEVARLIQEKHAALCAQTVPYALFLKRCDPTINVDPLVGDFADAQALRLVEDAINHADLNAVLGYYKDRGMDPAVYFYEEFLRAHDRATSRGRGVHYSPPEVVSCIVRGVESILHESFGLSLDEAFLIDPCCGVGTFLRHIEQRTNHRPHMIGMELMSAPRSIAACLLARAKVVQQDWLSASDIDAGDRPLVILGNPPYSGHSSNPGKIADLMRDYREGLNERNPKWLQDDYVKFIRMAQHHIERAGRGILAFITNHSYLTNPTFRQMRRSLAQTFDQILVLDLHGNVKRLDGENENIFPIQMGVAISFFIKTAHPQEPPEPVEGRSATLPLEHPELVEGHPELVEGRSATLHPEHPDLIEGRSATLPLEYPDLIEGRDGHVRYASITGTRENKLHALSNLELPEATWSNVPIAAPFYLLTAHNSELTEEYHSFPSLSDIFSESTIGFATSRDAFAIAFTRDEMLERINAIRDGTASDEILRTRYGVGDLDIEHARQELVGDPNWEDKIIEVLYRPFDRRWTYYSRAIMERPRLPLMQDLMRENTALAIGRAGHATGSEQWDVVFCTDRPADLNLFRRGGAKLFPKHLYHGDKRLSNIAFQCSQPDDLFAYIYALLHSKAYRDRYAKFLQIDYPRIPIAQDPPAFSALAQLGALLLDTHLMRTASSSTPKSTIGQESLLIGGYEIPEKWRKDRAGFDGAEHLASVQAAVHQTLALQERIDRIIVEAPPWHK